MRTPKNDVYNLVEQWRSKHFGNELSLQKVVASLGSSTPIVRLNGKKSSSRHVLYCVESNLPVLLCHSGVVAWASHLETGNLVLNSSTYRRRAGYVPPFHAQTYISPKCEITVALDTQYDSSMLQFGQKLDDFAITSGLLKGQSVPRRKWQVFKDSNPIPRFFLTSPMFERKTPFLNSQAPLDYILDPCITSMLKGQKWFANPDRVRFFAYEGGSLIDLADSANPNLSNGDVIWFSFTMQYVVNHTWGPDVQVMDVVRVGRVTDELGNGGRCRRTLRVGDTVREDDDYRGGDHSEVIASGNSVGVKCPSDCEMVVDFGDRDTPICTKRKQCDDETEFIGDDMVDYDTVDEFCIEHGWDD